MQSTLGRIIHADETQAMQLTLADVCGLYLHVAANFRTNADVYPKKTADFPKTNAGNWISIYRAKNRLCNHKAEITRKCDLKPTTAVASVYVELFSFEFSKRIQLSVTKIKTVSSAFINLKKSVLCNIPLHDPCFYVKKAGTLSWQYRLDFKICK